MGLAVHIAREILCGPANFEQHLLDAATLAGVHLDGVVIDAGAEHGGDLLVPQHLFEHGAVQAHQGEAVRRMLDQLQAPVARHGVDDVDQQRLRHRVAGEGDEGVNHLFGIMSRGAGVPQCERGDAVGVYMFGSAFELGERGDSLARRVCLVVVDLQQHGLIGLDDQRSIGHSIQDSDPRRHWRMSSVIARLLR
ncbi:Uncharacterised protein [Mycobacteroides abscessus subsp. abscessus]|nr:Uncharacterised protein [Mycobacteroides abscessus subsp. abscessus]